MVRIVRDGMDEMGCDGWEFHLRGDLLEMY